MVIEVVLVLLTVIAVTAAAAMAPGRLRARAARRGPSRRRASRPTARARPAAFLAVCASCLEMVEADEALGRCPACGGELAVRRRIRPLPGRSHDGRSPGAPARR